MDNLRSYFSDSEWETIEKIKYMFGVMENLAAATVDGGVRGLIVYGPPGVSKTYNINRVLNEKTFKFIFEDDGISYNIISGYMRTPHLFMELYHHRDPSNVLVIDDCDSALQDQDSLMLLKAALDTTDKRVITYNALSPALRRRQIPNSFEFNGSIIFVTNTDFKNCHSQKLKDHLAAIMSRCHYLDITISNREEKFLWIKYVSLVSDMLFKRGLNINDIMLLLDYIHTNLSSMNDLSLRAVIKLSEIYNIDRSGWKETADLTLLS